MVFSIFYVINYNVLQQFWIKKIFFFFMFNSLKKIDYLG